MASDPIRALAEAISPPEAKLLASSLEIDGRIATAVAELDGSRREYARAALRSALAELGDAGRLSSVLRLMQSMGERVVDKPRMVWSGPTFAGDSDHTTKAIANLIDFAEHEVLASTYSATLDSPFVMALRRALQRGRKVTLIVDGMELASAGEKLASELSGAIVWKYALPVGTYGVQHSKVIVIDSSIALVTSANLSKAAAERNLEAGLLIRDRTLASGISRRFSALRAAGQLLDKDADVQLVT